jgi:ABC-type Fe3+-siderophore transport system permease subunit
LRRPSLGTVYAVLGLGALVVACVSTLVGHGSLGNDALAGVFLRLRAGRLAAAFLTGSALSIAGVLVQGLFKNPLASPSIIGTTAGANLGGQIALLLGHWLFGATLSPWLAPDLLLPVGCVLGALASLLLLLALVRTHDDLVVLLLTGFLLSSLFISIGAFVTSLARERWELSRAMLSFALGDISGTGPRQIVMAAPLVAIGAAFAWSWSRPLDLMLSGEEEARSLGADVPLVRRWVVVWSAVLSAAAVALGGNVGFVGLVVPHALRPFVGTGHQALLPACALAGGTFVVACDIACRLVPGQSELPLGVVTGLIGAPTFLWLLMRQRARVNLG